MHAVVHMFLFLWGVCSGVNGNQAKRFLSNAHFFDWKQLSEKALEGTLSEWKYWQYAFTPPCHYGHNVKTTSQVWLVEEGTSNWDCSLEFTVVGKPVPHKNRGMKAQELFQSHVMLLGPLNDSHSSISPSTEK